MTESEIRDLLRGMADEPVPADSLARVRGRLAGRIGARARWRGVSWVLAGAALCAGMILFVVPWKTRQQTMAARPAVTQVVQVPPPLEPSRVIEPPQPARTKAHRVTHRLRPGHKETAPGVTIRIETPDPDVVIILSGQ